MFDFFYSRRIRNIEMRCNELQRAQIDTLRSLQSTIEALRQVNREVGGLLLTQELDMKERDALKAAFTSQ